MPETLQVLVYEYVPDMAERRAPHREAHLALIGRWFDEGRIVMAGGTGDPVSGGLIVFRVSGPAEVEEFVAADPYGAAGLVVGHRVMPWTVVVP
jgi:uncharacterized protein YciI